jgi:hypothetical protein
MRVLDSKIDRFLPAALAGAYRAPPRSRRNSWFSADASGSSCPIPAIQAIAGRIGSMKLGTRITDQLAAALVAASTF